MRLDMQGIFITVVCMVLVACITCEHNVTKRSSWKNRNISSSKMVKDINQSARDEMLIRYTGEMNSYRAIYGTPITQCSEKMEKAMKECKECVKREQQFHKNPCVFLLTHMLKLGKKIEELFNHSYTETGKLVKYIAKELKHSLGKLGKNSAKFLKDLGKFTDKLANDLSKGTGRVIQSSVQGLKKVGDDLVKLGDAVAKEVGKGVEDLSKGIGKSLDDLGKETGKLMNGIEGVTNDVGKGVHHVATQVFKPVHNIMSGVSRTVSGWFGKRDLDRKRRCSMNCDMCKKVDNTKYSVKQIVSNICGSGIHALQTKADMIIKNLQALFDIVNPDNSFSMIKHVRYDLSSDYNEEDVYEENYVTYQLKGKSHEFKSKSAIQILDRNATGKAIGKQIMNIIRTKDYSLV